mmetsp:Transcript_42083/g.122094  ORF Transcript_42083/g.122094 Transcript_42083/m.122094 type:complete len:293 (+) Transcript_42083:1276-2154(+)
MLPVFVLPCLRVLDYFCLGHTGHAPVFPACHCALGHLPSLCKELRGTRFGPQDRQLDTVSVPQVRPLLRKGDPTCTVNFGAVQQGSTFKNRVLVLQGVCFLAGDISHIIVQLEVGMALSFRLGGIGLVCVTIGPHAADIPTAPPAEEKCVDNPIAVHVCGKHEVRVVVRFAELQPKHDGLVVRTCGQHQDVPSRNIPFSAKRERRDVVDGRSVLFRQAENSVFARLAIKAVLNAEVQYVKGAMCCAANNGPVSLPPLIVQIVSGARSGCHLDRCDAKLGLRQRLGRLAAEQP